jgi:RimJ/RimL family protein N-acetyltransferase
VSAAPFLTTERLELWQPQAGDLEGMVALFGSEETRRFLGPAKPTHDEQFNRLLRDAGGWQLFGYAMLVVRLAGTLDIIGKCGVFHSWRGFGKGMDDVPEAGWSIHIDHCGKGYASEAMRAVLAWFDAAHGPRRIACMIEEPNVASHRLAKQLGFITCGSHVLEDDGVNLVLYERV